MKSKMKLDFSEEERPFGIQIFGVMKKRWLKRKDCEAVNPDLVDINFGCPVKK
jgi:tRNA-dihydrouridine synthase